MFFSSGLLLGVSLLAPPLMASLNPLIPSPSPLPSWGNLPGPKMISTINRMNMMWVGWNKPSNFAPPGLAAQCAKPNNSSLRSSLR